MTCRIWSAGQILFDLNDMKKVIGRTVLGLKRAILRPRSTGIREDSDPGNRTFPSFPRLQLYNPRPLSNSLDTLTPLGIGRPFRSIESLAETGSNLVVKLPK